MPFGTPKKSPSGASRWLVFGVLPLLGCSLSTLDEKPCRSDLECRDNFGLGSICGENGLCADTDPHPRCSETFPPGLFSDPMAAQKHHLIGTLFDSTNETHEVRLRSAQLAVRQINDAGGLEGTPFALVQCAIEPALEDGHSSTSEGAVSAAGYLVNTLGLPAIVGPAISEDVLNVFERLRGTQTFVISPSATSPALTSIDATDASDERPGLLWRTAPPDSLQGEAIAASMTLRNVASVAVIVELGAYGEGLFEFFARNYSGFSRLETFENQNQWSAAVASAGVSTAEEVLFIASSQSDVENFLQAAGSNEEFDSKNIFLTDSAATESVIIQIPEQLMPRIRGTRPSQLTNSAFNFGAFSSAYSAAYGGQDVTLYSFAAHTYDAAWITMLGFAWAKLQVGEINGTAIAQGARRLSAGEESEFVPSKWNGMLQAFRNGRSVDVLGTSGSLDFDPVSEETSAPIDLWSVEVRGGIPRLVVEDTVQPTSPATLSSPAAP